MHFCLGRLWSSLGYIGITFGDGERDRDSFRQYGEEKKHESEKYKYYKEDMNLLWSVSQWCCLHNSPPPPTSPSRKGSIIPQWQQRWRRIALPIPFSDSCPRGLGRASSCPKPLSQPANGGEKSGVDGGAHSRPPIAKSVPVDPPEFSCNCPTPPTYTPYFSLLLTLSFPFPFSYHRCCRCCCCQ